MSGADHLRVLYIDTYTDTPRIGERASSDAIGYGITCSDAIRNRLTACGIEVVRLVPEPVRIEAGGAVGRLEWILRNYRDLIDALREKPPDLIFFFHSFTVFPAEVRRILLDLGHNIPLIGYTQGSHWDPTDTFRFERYPGLELMDLANLASLDQILVTSQYMADTLSSNITQFQPAVGSAIAEKIRVVGLPLNMELIDSCRTGERFPRTTVVFNHAPISAKRPEMFLRVMASLMPRYPVDVLVTRRFYDGDPGSDELRKLVSRFGDRVILGGDMTLPEYYRALWNSHIQVSTATHESFGIATLEAMYTENACILPRAGSYPEICDDDPDVLYDPSSDQLEKRLAYFLENPHQRDRVAARLPSFARRHSPGEVGDRIVEVFLGARPPSGTRENWPTPSESQG